VKLTWAKEIRREVSGIEEAKALGESRIDLPIPTIAIGSGHCDRDGSLPKILVVFGNPDMLKPENEVLTNL